MGLGKSSKKKRENTAVSIAKPRRCTVEVDTPWFLRQECTTASRAVPFQTGCVSSRRKALMSSAHARTYFECCNKLERVSVSCKRGEEKGLPSGAIGLPAWCPSTSGTVFFFVVVLRIFHPRLFCGVGVRLPDVGCSLVRLHRLRAIKLRGTTCIICTAVLWCRVLLWCRFFARSCRVSERTIQGVMFFYHV